jgi:arylsulfatase A-like enzyme
MTLHPLKEYFASHKIEYVVTNSGIGDFDDEKYGAGIYERVVSFIDNELGKILEYVDFDNTILILLADHGQKVPYEDTSEVDFQPKLDHAVDFGKKILPKSAHKAGGEFLYNIRKFAGKRKLNKANEKLTNYQKRSRETFDNVSLFDEMLHVPLLFVNNNINPGIISNTVNHTDILPTLCGILNINLNHKINGRNLLPLIQGNSIKENPIYLRTRPYIDSKLDKRDSVGIRTSNYKYFRSIHNPKDSVHLYDLKNDPYENNNIAETNKELVDKLEELLLEIQENDFSENNGENVEELTHDEIEYELKKMGYV